MAKTDTMMRKMAIRISDELMTTKWGTTTMSSMSSVAEVKY